MCNEHGSKHHDTNCCVCICLQKAEVSGETEDVKVAAAAVTDNADCTLLVDGTKVGGNRQQTAASPEYDS